MKTKTGQILLGAFAAGLLLFATNDAQAYTVVPPTLGHAFPPSIAYAFSVFDNTVCFINASPGQAPWATPILLDSTKTTVAAYQYAFFNSGLTNTGSAIVSLYSNGTVANWSGPFTTAFYIGSIANITSSESAFIKSNLGQWSSGSNDCLHHFMINNI